jgi:hypothetical protein
MQKPGKKFGANNKRNKMPRFQQNLSSQTTVSQVGSQQGTTQITQNSQVIFLNLFK